MSLVQPNVCWLQISKRVAALPWAGHRCLSARCGWKEAQSLGHSSHFYKRTKKNYRMGLPVGSLNKPCHVRLGYQVGDGYWGAFLVWHSKLSFFLLTSQLEATLQERTQQLESLQERRSALEEQLKKEIATKVGTWQWGRVCVHLHVMDPSLLL